MDPVIRNNFPALHTALQARNPRAAEEFRLWVNGGGPLSASTIALLTTVAPDVGIPGPSITAAVSRSGGARAQGTQSPVEGNVPETPPGAGLPVGSLQAASTAAPPPPPIPNPAAPVIPRPVPNNPRVPQRDLGEQTVSSAPPTPTLPAQTGDFNAPQGKWLSEDDDMLLRFAMKAAGFNPDVLTRGTKSAMGALRPMMEAFRAAFGAGQGERGNVGALPAAASEFAKQFTTPGMDFYGNARRYAQGVMGSPDFGGFLGQVADEDDKIGMMAALVPLLYGGANPMVQQSINDQLKKLFSGFGDEEFYSGKQSTLADYLSRQQGISPAIQALFGPVTRR